MQPLYDPQDILKILRLPEQAKPVSVFRLLSSLLLPPLHYLRQVESWFCIKTINPVKTGGE